MPELSPESRQCLLGLARAAVHDAVHDSDSVQRLLDETRLIPQLEEPRGAFVSLKMRSAPERERDALRGCIGSVVATEPLYRTVIHVAAKAACEDPRFPSLTAAELDGVRIEISVLTPLRAVTGPGEIEVGRDGVQLVKGLACAVFLPQVGGERSWSVEELLKQLALKAGLPAEEWVGAELKVFQADVFKEA